MNQENEQTIEISGEINGERVALARYTQTKPKIEGKNVILPIKVETLSNNPTTFHINYSIDVEYILKALLERLKTGDNS